MLNLNSAKDYLTLCKPKVVLLMLVTAWVGMYLASPQLLNWQAIIFGTIGIACAAGSAAIINHLMDREIDRKMSRTSARPIAAGKITPLRALTFATTLAVIAAALLINFVNIITTV